MNQSGSKSDAGLPEARYDSLAKWYDAWVRGYFDEGEWHSSDPHGLRGRVGARHRMLSTYLNALGASGFRLERMVEPAASATRLAQAPGNREVPTVLFVRAIRERVEQE